jgi:hypothetical protein
LTAEELISIPTSGELDFLNGFASLNINSFLGLKTKNLKIINKLQQVSKPTLEC